MTAISENRRFTYKLYGLNIVSDFKLPCSQGNDSAEVDLRIRKVAAACSSSELAQLSGQKRAWGLTGDSVCFHRQDKFMINYIPAAGEVRVSLLQGYQENYYVNLFTIIAGFVLHVRRCIPLHAGCLYQGNKAYAFLGRSGAGKSTIAALLNCHGYRVIDDNLTAIEVADKYAMVNMGIGRIKLWPSSAKMLELSAKELEPVSADNEKVYFPADKNSSRNPAKKYLSRIYFLAADKNGNDAIVNKIPNKHMLPILEKHVLINKFPVSAGMQREFAARLLKLAANVEDTMVIYNPHKINKDNIGAVLDL